MFDHNMFFIEKLWDG